MCGIAGFSLTETDRRKVNSKRLARHMLLDIELRGHDATGFAFRDSNNDIQIHKKDETASVFIKNRNLCLPRRAGTAILHTRAATQGSVLNPGNNHPIRSGKFVGVHNGIIWNDDEIFRAIGKDTQQAQVDSEAIWAAMMYGDLEPSAVLELLEGSAAVAWLHDDDDAHTLHLARANDSPLYVAEMKGGSLLFGSTQRAIAWGAEAVGLKPETIRSIDEGKQLRVKEGTVVDVASFMPSEKRRSYGMYGGTTQVWRSQYNTDRRVQTPHQMELTPLSEHVSMVRSPSPTLQFFGADLLDIERPTPTMENEDYYRIHAKREKDIEAWLEDIHVIKDQEQHQNALTHAYYNLHANARPGSRITTGFAGETRYGEIVRLPDEFPSGVYVIRVWVPIDHYRPNVGWESVIVGRTCNEFWEVVGQKNDEIEAEVDAEMTEEEFEQRVEEIVTQLGGEKE